MAVTPPLLGEGSRLPTTAPFHPKPTKKLQYIHTHIKTVGIDGHRGWEGYKKGAKSPQRGRALGGFSSSYKGREEG